MTPTKWLTYVLFIALVTFAGNISTGWTQTLSRSGYYANERYHPQSRNHLQRNPYFPGAIRYYLTPDPAALKKWSKYNRLQDRLEDMRSPLNRESWVDYMLRTF